MASKTRVGCRAITLQQPFAAAMVNGVNVFTRRGKATAFSEEGEWVAIHCGSNAGHLNNKATMENVRKAWPECPSESGQPNCYQTTPPTTGWCHGDHHVDHHQ